MSKKVYITGIGIISAIGNNVAEVESSLENSISGIGPITNLNTIHKGKLPVAEVKCSNEELKLSVGLPNDNYLTRTSLLGMVAAKEALLSAKISNISEFRTGLISATSVGGMDKSEDFYRKFLLNDNSRKLRDVITHDNADSTERIADYLGVKDFVTTISTACSSSANSIMLGARLIKHNILDRVIVGGTDALTKFTLNGFNTLMIVDKEKCKPFDQNRMGLTLGEGAGFIVLESEGVVKNRGKEALAELTGYANANDAYHQTASSPEGFGAFLAMKKAMEVGGLSVGDIDYINVHGTGTENNDLSEGKALKRIFGNKIPPFSSTKAFTGHTLGAAGGIEAVISVLSIRNRMIFPNLNFTTPIEELGLIPVTEVIRNIDIKNVLSNSFGFGGNNSTLIISRK